MNRQPLYIGMSGAQPAQNPNFWIINADSSVGSLPKETLRKEGTSPPQKILLAGFSLKSQEIKELKERIDTLEKHVHDLMRKIPEVIDLRDISFAQAKHEIELYFKEQNGQRIDPSDIEECLGIDIETAISVCDELEKEGKIRSL